MSGPTAGPGAASPEDPSFHTLDDDRRQAHGPAQRDHPQAALRAVEALGNTTVICPYKSGTLTQNRMLVQEIYASGDPRRLESLWGEAPLAANRAMDETLRRGCSAMTPATASRGAGGGPPERPCWWRPVQRA